jgi:hypothetical protein
MSDAINPAHYKDGKIEVIDYIEDKKLGFCLGNAVKYISRAGKKDPNKEIEDLQKALWYIERRIKELEEQNTQKEQNTPRRICETCEWYSPSSYSCNIRPTSTFPVGPLCTCSSWEPVNIKE